MPEITLRDQIAGAVDAAPEIEAPVEAPEAPAEAAPAEPSTEGRARDAAGRFTSSAAPQEKPTGSPPSPEAAPAVAAPRKAPSSWKKDHWEAYGKLDSGLQDYIEQREREFANGVSTYKAEAERAREFHDAIAPFQGDLQAAGVTPGQWVSSVAQAHVALSRGTPQQRISTLQQLAANYQVPVQLAVQGQNGQWSLLGQAQRQAPQPDVRALVQQTLQDERLNTEVQAMAGDTANYPHFQAVSGTMIGLLRSNLAQDLKSAYEAALRMPAHAELYQAMQEQQRKAEEAQKQAEAQAVVNRARANTISPRTATPSANMVAAGKKGLRDTIAENYEAVAGGRI